MATKNKSILNYQSAHRDSPPAKTILQNLCNSCLSPQPPPPPPPLIRTNFEHDLEKGHFKQTQKNDSVGLLPEPAVVSKPFTLPSYIWTNVLSKMNQKAKFESKTGFYYSRSHFDAEILQIRLNTKSHDNVVAMPRSTSVDFQFNLFWSDFRNYQRMFPNLILKNMISKPTVKLWSRVLAAQRNKLSLSSSCSSIAMPKTPHPSGGGSVNWFYKAHHIVKVNHLKNLNLVFENTLRDFESLIGLPYSNENRIQLQGEASLKSNLDIKSKGGEHTSNTFYSLDVEASTTGINCLGHAFTQLSLDILISIAENQTKSEKKGLAERPRPEVLEISYGLLIELSNAFENRKLSNEIENIAARVNSGGIELSLPSIVKLVLQATTKDYAELGLLKLNSTKQQQQQQQQVQVQKKVALAALFPNLKELYENSREDFDVIDYTRVDGLRIYNKVLNFAQRSQRGGMAAPNQDSKTSFRHDCFDLGKASNLGMVSAAPREGGCTKSSANNGKSVVVWRPILKAETQVTTTKTTNDTRYFMVPYFASGSTLMHLQRLDLQFQFLNSQSDEIYNQVCETLFRECIPKSLQSLQKLTLRCFKFSSMKYFALLSSEALGSSSQRRVAGHRKMAVELEWNSDYCPDMTDTVQVVDALARIAGSISAAYFYADDKTQALLQSSSRRCQARFGTLHLTTAQIALYSGRRFASSDRRPDSQSTKMQKLRYLCGGLGAVFVVR